MHITRSCCGSPDEVPHNPVIDSCTTCFSFRCTTSPVLIRHVLAHLAAAQSAGPFYTNMRTVRVHKHVTLWGKSMAVCQSRCELSSAVQHWCATPLSTHVAGTLHQYSCEVHSSRSAPCKYHMHILPAGFWGHDGGPGRPGAGPISRCDQWQVSLSCGMYLTRHAGNGMTATLPELLCAGSPSCSLWLSSIVGLPKTT